MRIKTKAKKLSKTIGSAIKKQSLLASALLSTASLFSIAYPAIERAFSGDYAQLEGSVIESTPNKAIITIKNTGNSEAIIKKGKAVTTFRREVIGEEVFSFKSGYRKIEPDQIIIVKTDKSKLNSMVAKKEPLKTPKNGNPLDPGDTPTTECILEIQHIIPGSKPRTSEIHYRCYAVSIADY